MISKLKNRLSLIFILFSLTIISLIIVLNYIYIEKKINIYTQEKIEYTKQETFKNISKTYKDGKWNISDIEVIGSNVIKKGLIISIKDASGNTIWDARKYNNLECEKSLAKIRDNTNKINPKSNVENTIEKFEIYANKKVVGSLNIEYLGPLYYDNHDVILFEILNRTLFILAIVFFILSIILGMLVSTSLSNPILKVVESTNLISKGNYSDRIKVKSSIDEVNQLIESVNKMASNLEYQDKLRKMLTRDISHELRTPLTTIQVQLEAIMDGLWEPSPDRLNSIYEELQRLNRLIVASEELSKYDNGYIELNKTEVDISKISKNIFINFEKQLLDKDINLELNIDKCKISVDKDKISQVILNIFSNSIRYTNKGGKIIITCFEDESMVYISIKDNGIGISKKDIDKIFERFYRTDKSRSQCSGGLGVGLTISKDIVKAHKGEISVTSEINNGTEFIVKLPKI